MERIDIFQHAQTLEAFIATLDCFGHETPVDAAGADLSRTIAIVAFMPYGTETAQGQGQALTVAMLNACERSMSRYGLGRVVVVVSTADDRASYERIVPTSFGHTAVVFRVATDVKTRFIPTNMPFGAIVGLQGPLSPTTMTGWGPKPAGTRST